MIDNDIRIKTNAPINDNGVNKLKIKTEESLPFDVVDPTKVTKPAKQESGNNTNNNGLKYNSDSVFEKFIQALKNSPVLSEGARKILLNNQFINHNIKTDPVLSTLFENFLKSIEMDGNEILNFLKFQQNSNTKFHGDFFDSLRNILKSNLNNNDFKSVLRNFLKSYDCFVSVDETYTSIQSSLKNIYNTLPQMLKQPFSDLVDKLILDNYSNSLDINLTMLKNEIIPFIGRYIAKMNDFGPVRDYVSVLVHNMVRLESSSKENFSTDLDNLFDYLKFNLNIGDKELQKIKLSLITNYETTKTIKNDSIDSFIKLIESGIKDSNNLVNKGVMEEITESLLFSQNVNIPLTHMFLPLNYNGMFMFSELWISKNYENSKDNEKKNKYEPSETYKIFLTFDIQNIGYFETILVLKDSKVSLEISVPSSFKNHTKSIKSDISKILIDKNITISDIYINECIKKRRFNEVFNNLSERKSGVDVIV
ncbi:hypothetical protein J2Z76_001583 [Sedimentibacter acidaminivorans]|uniref:Flagellar hook-length control protein-like C-terminal domain-containing protein n=1 Tax=Sedimentibacter acidaminivorans TaxID=913099 RepID=A0ABS4GDZ8_9FIRM|nr:hypothetical protein [Sedimentibacter acidaminivorans]MBP1925722.1 hypothetical protein [Sedimentibacter acidaminivorans]